MNEIQTELAKLTKLGGGILKPEAVVESARQKKSPLHDCFTWDDTAAASRYRLWQARQLIRVSVIVLEGDSKPIRAYVSLMDDRTELGGGYRTVQSVLSDKEMRARLLDEALAELQAMKARYGQLKELASVFAAAEKASKRNAV